eukprot:g1185.t1
MRERSATGDRDEDGLPLPVNMLPLRYWAIWDDILLLSFDRRDQCKAFFGPGGSANMVASWIDLDDVMSVRVREEDDGLLLVGLLPQQQQQQQQQQEWILHPEGGQEAHTRWLEQLAGNCARRHKKLFAATHDAELDQEQQHVDQSRLAPSTRSALVLLRRGKYDAPDMLSREDQARLEDIRRRPVQIN